MELINYLNQNFYSKAEFLQRAGLTAEKLAQLQSLKVMPLASHKIQLTVACDSLLGDYHNVQTIEYYAKGYLPWLVDISALDIQQSAQSLFTDRYKLKLQQLQGEGFINTDINLQDNFNSFVEQEWQHFLQGTYGLCTKSGLPEDIAAKELAVMIIKQLTEKESLNTMEINKLEKAVNLLDSASSLFAPHERAQSSREILINQIRNKYQLKANISNA